MPNHNTRNNLYWITWEVSSLLMKFDQFVPYYKRKNNNEIFLQKLRPEN